MAAMDAEVIQSPHAGLNTQDAPDMMPDGMAPEHKNLLVHHERQSRMRGPLRDHDELEIGANEIITGTWAFGNKALIGIAAPSATAQQEYQTAPFIKAASASVLAEPETTMKLVDFAAMTVSNVSAAQGTVIGGRGTRMGAYTYGFAYSGTTDDLVDGGYQHRRLLLRWDGSTSAPSAVTNAPYSGQYVTTHYNRLFVLGGVDAPGALTTYEPNTLFFSDPGGPVNLTAADWQDDNSGLTNKIVIDVDNPDDFGVALARVGGDLVIFKRRSIHMLYGDSPENFTYRPFTYDKGCVDARTVVEGEGGVYFLSEEGYHFFDGHQIHDVSDQVLTEINSNTYNTVGGNLQHGARAEATLLPNEYLMLNFATLDFTDGDRESDKVQACYLYHMPTSRWTRFDSAATEWPTPNAIGSTSQTSYITDGTNVYVADYLTLPETVPAAERGIDNGEAGEARIPSVWKSRLTTLSTPLYYAQLHRVMLDYLFRKVGSDDAGPEGWYVTLTNADGRVLYPSATEDSATVPVVGENSSYLYRRRAVMDCFQEVTDCQLTVEWKAGEDVPAIADGIIYDAVLEFQTTRQRRSS